MSESSVAGAPHGPGALRSWDMEVLERGQLLDQLDNLLAEAGRGQGRLVLVRGEAGIGKTTLVREFTAGRNRRVLWGICDPVEPPRPLAPVFDIAGQTGGELQSALDSSDRNRILFAFLALLRAEGGPWVVVLEDMQWADESSVDVLRVVGRRVGQLPALVVVTYRDNEVGPGHILTGALGDIPRTSIATIDVPELSLAAVAQMSGSSTIDAVALHRAAAGNPYFVSEVIAAGDQAVPTSIRDAIVARASRLSPPALRLLRAASVLGQRCHGGLALAVAGGGAAEVDECVARGMLRRDGAELQFRHELTQRSVHESTPAAERTELHRRALDELRGPDAGADPAELARHASEGGDATAVVEFAPRAGAQAAALGSHRAATAHFASAIALGDLLPADQRAALFTAHARECFVTDDVGNAVIGEEKALQIWRDLGDPLNEGRCLTRLAQYASWNDAGLACLDIAAEAVRIFESRPPGPDLAAAYARSAQLSMILGQHKKSIPEASKALELAREFGDEEVLVNALDTLGCSLISEGDEGGWELLEESLERALSAELEEEAARAFNNLITCAVNGRQYAEFSLLYEKALAFFADRELDQSERCLIGGVIEALFGTGRWDEAERLARDIIQRGQSAGRMDALGVLGRLTARRGGQDAFDWLDEALEHQAAHGCEAGYPLRAYRAEAAWLAGDLRKVGVEIDAALAEVGEGTNLWYLGELATVAQRVGLELEVDRALPEPYTFYLGGYPQKAAAAWSDLGCPYEEAAMLAESDEEADLRRSLSMLCSLGAVPLATRVEERLKAIGARSIPRGPRASTKANVAGLSDREVEVLRLLARGLRNAEIAADLVVSTRTVDHHVSSILSKLGARSRFEAGQKAQELGLTSSG